MQPKKFILLLRWNLVQFEIPTILDYTHANLSCSGETSSPQGEMNNLIIEEINDIHNLQEIITQRLSAMTLKNPSGIQIVPLGIRSVGIKQHFESYFINRNISQY